jgi:hypothetical protein
MVISCFAEPTTEKNETTPGDFILVSYLDASGNAAAGSLNFSNH